MMPFGGLRECRATSFDQTPIGKWSRAGRLTRNAPRCSARIASVTCVNATPRRDIRRGPTFLTISCNALPRFPERWIQRVIGDGTSHTRAGSDESFEVAFGKQLLVCVQDRDAGNLQLSGQALVDGTRCPGRIRPSSDGAAETSRTTGGTSDSCCGSQARSVEGSWQERVSFMRSH